MKLTAEATVLNDDKLNTNINNAQNTADSAKTTAESAKNIADSTAQYFWFTSSGTDTGAHISEVTKAQFIASPSGGNLLARSNGIAVRDGLTELASFSASGVDINNGGASVANFGTTARVGKADTRHVEVNDDGLQVYAGSSTVMANIGYGSTNTGSGMGNAPYFTLGIRGSGSTIGNRSFAMGSNTIASGTYSFVGGTTVSESGSTTFSRASTASGDFSFAFGAGCLASDTNTAAFGTATTARWRNQFVVGKYNEPTSISTSSGAEHDIFTVGNGGSDSSRKTTFAVTDLNKVYVNGSVVHSSDKRLKEHINYLGDDAVDFIEKLKPAYYTKDGKKQVGFYAQDVAEADKWECMTDKMNGYMTLDYIELIAPLVAYCQKLEKRIEELERSK